MSFPHQITIKDWDKPVTDLYRTNAFDNGTDADIDDSAPVDDTDGFTSTITVKDKQTAATISFRYAAISSDTVDEPIFTLYKRIDDSIWEKKELSIDSVQIENDGSEKIYSYTIANWTHGAGYFRFALQSSGSTTKFDIHVTVKYFYDETFGS